MPIFTVQRSVDATVIYEAEVEATTAEEAARLAESNEDKYEWGTGDVCEYDARRFATLTEDGMEVEGSARGDW